jgi:exopolyphosphatase / guanosine-5'-triphosphate,3'-diphosphate pyrophosphatase
MKNGTLLAAIDLGSNSFRLEICRFNNGLFQRYEYLKEAVRQGSGLDADRNLSIASMEKGWECLARFAEKLSGFDRSQVRAVATQTLREARNAKLFLDKAHQILGFPIEVVSGREEARLIYQGVAHLLPPSDERRLVIDIGGRSTEFIIGQNKNALQLESYRLGSVAASMKYFSNGEFTLAAFQKAEVAAKAVLDEALPIFGKDAWDIAYGSSGTVSAVSEALTQAGWPADRVTKEGIDWLKAQLIRIGHVDKLKLDGLKEERKTVIGGGLSVLSALLDLFSIEELMVTPGALRHGVLYDLLDREDESKDTRALTVSGLRKAFQADSAQAHRVSKIASEFLKKLQTFAEGSSEWTRLQKKISWAAQLHEIGNVISHTDSHKHGAYILENTDTPGFAKHELHRLSLLVLGHKGKLRKLDIDFEDEHLVCQLLSLRLAVILCHARRDPEHSAVQLKKSKTIDRCFELTIDPLWAQRFPQSNHLLQQEALAWQKTSWKLRIQMA